MKINDVMINCIQGDDEFKLYVHATMSYSAIIVTIITIIFTLMDFTLKPKAIRKYKVQLHTNEPPDIKKLLKVNISQ